MIFYIATDPTGLKHVLTVEAEARKIDKNYVEIDQPNDKASLKKLIQESFDHIHQLEQQIAGSAPGVGSERSQEQVSDAPSVSPDQAEPSLRSDSILEESRPLKPTGIASDGHPVVRPHWTGPQLEVMFNKRPEHVQDICYAISRLAGPDLGYVAYQVAAQMTKPITINVEAPPPEE